MIAPDSTIAGSGLWRLNTATAQNNAGAPNERAEQEQEHRVSVERVPSDEDVCRRMSRPTD